MNETPTYIKSQKGANKLTFAGYIYVKDNTNDRKTYWRCENRPCKGRVITTNDNAVQITQQHTHAPDRVKLEVCHWLFLFFAVGDNLKRFVDRVLFGSTKIFVFFVHIQVQLAMVRLKDAALTHIPTSTIINQELAANIPAAVQACLPKETSMKRTVQRWRRKDQPQLPASSNDMKDTVVGTKWGRTIDGQDWVRIFDADGDACMLFLTIGNMTRLSASSVWYGDGTFSVTPKPYVQLYTIHGVVMDRVFPLAYALLGRKTIAAYSAMFNELSVALDEHELCIDTCCRVWRCDFEQAVIRSCDTDVELCFFHFCQAHWRKLQALGLGDLYSSDLEFALRCRMYTALAFMPPEAIEDAFDELHQTAPRELVLFGNYFQDTYVGKLAPSNRRGDRKRSKPLFPPEQWSVYERTATNEPRTTNSLEGWHARFSQIIGKSHPNVYEFITRLKEEQVHTEFCIEQHLSGVPPPTSRANVIRNNKRLAKVVSEYGRLLTCEYLRSIAHNIRY